MTNTKIDPFLHVDITYEKLAKPGLILMAGSDKPNPMTIGWATIGIIWGKPIFTVLVRPSRHTDSFLKKEGEFSVNVPINGMEKQVAVCGTKSGRDMDKIKECGFELTAGRHIEVPNIAQAQLVYECKTVQTNAVMKETFTEDIMGHYYPDGDFHHVYYGEILALYKRF